MDDDHVRERRDETAGRHDEAARGLEEDLRRRDEVGRARGDETGGGPAARGVPPSFGARRLLLGREAEEAAAAFLRMRGWRIVGQNVRIGRGELDLIARRRGVLAFVEVKARRSATCGAPEDAVSPRKRRQIARLVELWLAARPWALRGVDEVRFDIVAVDAGRRPALVRHLPAAFTCDG